MSYFSLFFIHWEEKFLSVHAKCMPTSKKPLSVDKSFTCQTMKFVYFFEILYFLISLTSKILVSNRKLRPVTAVFFIFDKCFLRQWLQFYVFSFIFSGPDITFLRQHSFLPGADIFFLCHCNDFLWFSCTDICFLCQCSEFLKKLVFSYHWHKNFMSAKP